jgi:tRNA (cmo5U34)-methyltransferase
MTDFNKTQWSNKEFSKNYVNESGLYLPYRNEIVELIIEYCLQFISCTQPRFLDLGCGDGYIASKILSKRNFEEIMLVDASSDMLKKAKERLDGFNNIEYKHSSFQEIINDKEISCTKYDFIFSSLAIHHLTTKQKKKLYTVIYKSLGKNGSFINYDVVLPTSSEIESWYLRMWKNWIGNNEQAPESLSNIPEQYKNNSDNIPCSLEDQVSMLNSIGFKNINCHFKYGIFAVFGGAK